MLSISLYSQIFNRFKLSSFEPVLSNPAYGFQYSKPSIKVLSSLAWIRLPSSPKDHFISFTLPYRSNMGINIAAEGNSVGITNMLSLNVNYFYHILLQNQMHISFGFGSKINYYQIKFNSLQNGIFDPIFASVKTNGVNIDFDAGIHIRDRFFDFGIAGFNITQNRAKLSDSVLFYIEPFSALVYAAYRWTNIPGTFELQPQIRIIYQQNSIISFSSLDATFNKDLTLGVSYIETFKIDKFAYRALLFPVKLRIKNFVVGIYYETAISRIAPIFGSSYGASLGYVLNKRKKIPSYF